MQTALSVENILASYSDIGRCISHYVPVVIGFITKTANTRNQCQHKRKQKKEKWIADCDSVCFVGFWFTEFASEKKKKANNHGHWKLPFISFPLILNH